MSAEDCFICLAPMQVDNEYIKLVCNHTYHKSCIRTWMDINAICPRCGEAPIDANSRSQESAVANQDILQVDIAQQAAILADMRPSAPDVAVRPANMDVIDLTGSDSD